MRMTKDSRFASSVVKQNIVQMRSRKKRSGEYSISILVVGHL
jgi:hypothetical protein